MSSKSNYVKKFLIILKTSPGEVPKCIGVFKGSQLCQALNLSSEKFQEEILKNPPGKIDIVNIDIPTDILI